MKSSSQSQFNAHRPPQGYKPPHHNIAAVVSSCTDTLEQNDFSGKKHMHVVETARSILLSAFVPRVFWGEAILTIICLINTISSYHDKFFSFQKVV